MHDYIIQLALIVTFGVVAQMMAWRLRLPTILLLMIFGFLAGPVTGLVHPDEVFGRLLFPLVSVSVAVILYEGGLSLGFKELKLVGGVVRNLVTIGILITWILSTLGAYYIIGLNFTLSLIFGAILVVTGPTVVLPLLRQIRPKGQTNSILKWEGIVNDPIGAVLAVLVFEGILASGVKEVTMVAIGGLLKTIGVSGLIGIAGAYIVVLLLKYRLIPDFLQNPASLMMVFCVFGASNMVLSESGLFGVTVMGIALANQKQIQVKHIIEFKENLRVLLISVLFIVLAARLDISKLTMLSWNIFLFLVFLVIIVRPVVVFFSTIKSHLNWKEKVFLSWMAPRGIVAAAVSSIFTIELVRIGIPQAELLISLTFVVIIGTIAVYGIGAMPLARWLKISDTDPQGVLILGAQPFAVEIAGILKKNGFKVLLVDSNWSNITSAREAGLPTYHGSILSEYILDEIDLTGMGYLLALTPNEEVNSLAALYFSKIFGSENVYQLSVESEEHRQGHAVSQELRGNILFGSQITYPYLVNKFGGNCRLTSAPIETESDGDGLSKENSGKEVVPLFLIDDGPILTIYTRDFQPAPVPGQTLISLVS